MIHSFKAYYREQEISLNNVASIDQISEQLSLKYPQFKDGCICICQITSFSHLVNILEQSHQHPQFSIKIRLNPLINEKLMEQKKNHKIIFKGSKKIQEMKFEAMGQRHQKNVQNQSYARAEKKELKRQQPRENDQQETQIKELRQSMIEVLQKQLQKQREKNKQFLQRQLKKMKQQFQKTKIDELKQQLKKHTNKVTNLEQLSEENTKGLTALTNSLKSQKEQQIKQLRQILQKLIITEISKNAQKQQQIVQKLKLDIQNDIKRINAYIGKKNQRKKSLAKKSQQIVDEYNDNYEKITKYMINQQQPNQIKQGENKTVEPTINHKAISNQSMIQDNPLINYRQKFEAISQNNLTKQQKKSPYKQNNKYLQIDKNETKKPIQTPFQNQSSDFFSTMQHPQIKTQNNNNIKGGIMDSSPMKKKQSHQKTKKSQEKNKNTNNTRQLTLQQKRKQYSYKLVDTVQYVALKPRENYIWTITLSNDGTDWEDQMIIIDKINNKTYKVGMLIGNNLKRVQLGPFVQYKRGITERQFAIGYKTEERPLQKFYQIGDKFKVTLNVIEPGVTKQKQFEERINYLIRVYIITKNIKPKPMQQILKCFDQVGITQKTFANSNEEVLIDLLLELHNFRQ